jgi:hypothetical protein
MPVLAKIPLRVDPEVAHGSTTRFVLISDGSEKGSRRATDVNYVGLVLDEVARELDAHGSEVFQAGNGFLDMLIETAGVRRE